MSKAEYTVQIHVRAQKELRKAHDHASDIIVDTLKTAAERRSPTRHPNIDSLEADEADLLSVHADEYRAIVAFEKPTLYVLLIERRRRVYDRLDTAVERLEK